MNISIYSAIPLPGLVIGDCNIPGIMKFDNFVKIYRFLSKAVSLTLFSDYQLAGWEDGLRLNGRYLPPAIALPIFPRKRLAFGHVPSCEQITPSMRFMRKNAPGMGRLNR
jgi:hypothetical protein